MLKENILIEKYRPKTINELICTSDIINLYNSIVKTKKIPNLLLYGYSGQGKSSFIKILVDELKYNSIYINGSEERGNNILNLIDNFSNKYTINKNNHKIIIIDEADSIIYDTQLKIQQKIKSYKHITFCFLCNYINKISEYIKSLCIDINFKLDFSNNKKQIINYLKGIIKKEKIKIKNEDVENIYNISKCDIRKMINMLINKKKIKIKSYTEPNYILEYADIKNNIFNNNCSKSIQKYRLLNLNSIY